MISGITLIYYSIKSTFHPDHHIRNIHHYQYFHPSQYPSPDQYQSITSTLLTSVISVELARLMDIVSITSIPISPVSNSLSSLWVYLTSLGVETAIEQKTTLVV